MIAPSAAAADSNAGTEPTQDRAATRASVAIVDILRADRRGLTGQASGRATQASGTPGIWRPGTAPRASGDPGHLAIDPAAECE